MNARKTLLIASAMIAAASTLSSRAADQGVSIEQQMAEGDGYYSEKQEPVKPETALQVKRGNELLRQMTEGDGYDPLTAVGPAPRPALPETARQLKADKDLARQMAAGEGYVPQDPVRSAGSQAVATAQVEDKEWAKEQAADDGYSWPTAAINVR